MKIRCKHCSRKIGITDYSCPVCGTVNFSTDGEVQAAYNRNKSRNAVITLIAIPAAFILLIGGITTALYFGITAHNNKEIARIKQKVGYDEANGLCGNKFSVYAFKTGDCPPTEELFIDYLGDSFIGDSVTFCNSLYDNLTHYDFFSVTIRSGENRFRYDFDTHCARTNMLFDYSELESLTGLSRLSVYGITEEHTEHNYSFEVAFLEK